MVEETSLEKNEQEEEERKAREEAETREREEREDEERKSREEAEKREKEEIERQKQLDKKIDDLSLSLSEKVSEDLLDEVFTRVSLEWHVSEQVRDKIVNDEISTQPQSYLRRFCTESVDEYRRELDRVWRSDLRDRIQQEIFDRVVYGNLDLLVRECCDRTIWEAQTQRAADIYETLLDEIVGVESMDRLFLEIIFEEMTGLVKPFIEKIKIPPPKPVIQPQTPRSIKRPPQDSQIESSLVSKKLKTTTTMPSVVNECEEFETDPEKCGYFWDFGLFDGDLTEFSDCFEVAKDFLASYFRKYNFVRGFTFEELDEIIEMFAIAMGRHSSEPAFEHAVNTSLSKFMARILLKVRI